MFRRVLFKSNHMVLKARIPAATIAGKTVRLYEHPTIPNGRPWCAIEDMAAFAGYDAEQAEEAAKAWQTAYPGLSEVGDDGAVIVSDTAVCGFFAYLGMMDLETVDALRTSYDTEIGKAWLALTAHLPYAEWQQAAQRSALADALSDPAAAAN